MGHPEQATDVRCQTEDGPASPACADRRKGRSRSSARGSPRGASPRSNFARSHRMVGRPAWSRRASDMPPSPEGGPDASALDPLIPFVHTCVARVGRVAATDRVLSVLHCPTKTTVSFVMGIGRRGPPGLSAAHAASQLLGVKLPVAASTRPPPWPPGLARDSRLTVRPVPTPVQPAPHPRGV